MQAPVILDLNVKIKGASKFLFGDHSIGCKGSDDVHRCAQRVGFIYFFALCIQKGSVSAQESHNFCCFVLNGRLDGFVDTILLGFALCHAVLEGEPVSVQEL